jgi:ABC-2 type transport system ATP-binding protein
MSDAMAVRVRGLRKRYRGVGAVDGVDLDVGHGEVVALLGPNGAGKTTTVEILEGYRDRDAGEVRVLGVDPRGAPIRWRRGIGVVLQEAADVGELTVAETVRHFARYYPDARDPDEMIALVGLVEKARARVATLSGGQRRRLDVAIGVVGNPRLLFLDEPTTGFDPQARRQFWSLIRSLADEHGTTILLTTHYLDEAEALADRVTVIVNGRIVADGDPATLGGRATAEASVAWDEPSGRRTVRTPDPGAVVAALVRQHGGDVPGLTVTRPSLEDVYLTLIGADRP